MSGGRCDGCGHAEHKKACRAKGPSRCVPLETPDGGIGFACGVRPPCPCPRQVCTCGLPVAVASLDGTELDTAIVRGSAGSGNLAVRKLPDGRLAARELADGQDPFSGEWRGTEHMEWPDHGPVAEKYAGPYELPRQRAPDRARRLA